LQAHEEGRKLGRRQAKRDSVGRWGPARLETERKEIVKQLATLRAQRGEAQAAKRPVSHHGGGVLGMLGMLGWRGALRLHGMRAGL
jgi:hypothetical protein